MLNTVRQITTMLCFVEQDTHLECTIYSGWNQIKRIQNEYRVFRLDNLNRHYTVLPAKHMPDFLRKTCNMLIDSGIMEDYQEQPHMTENISTATSHTIEPLKLVG